MTRIEIDPNVRVRGNQTYAGYEDVSGEMPSVGDDVEVFESESGLHGHGTVVELDEDRRLVYLEIEWDALQWGLEPVVVAVWGVATYNPLGSLGKSFFYSHSGQEDTRTAPAPFEVLT